MELYRIPEGLARRDGDELVVLDVPYGDWSAAFADGIVADHAATRRRVPLAGASLLAPIADPSTLVVCGANYRSHIEELGQEPPATPQVAVTTDIAAGLVVGTGRPIVLPAVAPAQVDYEGELAVVIGKVAREVRAGAAWSHVAGVTITNDVSERDGQLRAMREGGDIARHKAHPTFKPVGPGLLTVEALPDRLDLEVRTRVNDELRQQGRTGDFLFTVPELVAWVTRTTTLLPGDLICTGTPGGVGLTTGRFLAPGDVVEVEVESLGTLRNPVVAAGPPR